MLNTLVIIALQQSRRVFWFSFDYWLRTPWFFSRSRTTLAFSSFFTQKTFFLFPLGGDSRYFYLLLLTSFFLVFPIPWILVDIRLVNIYIYIYILAYLGSKSSFNHILLTITDKDFSCFFLLLVLVREWDVANVDGSCSVMFWSEYMYFRPSLVNVEGRRRTDHAIDSKMF